MGVFHNHNGVNRIHIKKEWEKFGQGKKKGSVSLGLPTQKNFFIRTEKFYEALMVTLQQ